jgi:hypothetical protein
MARRGTDSWTRSPASHYTGHVEELMRAGPAGRRSGFAGAATFQTQKAGA